MPFYDYRCHKCELEKTAQRNMTERNDGPLCPKCKKKMKKLSNAVPVHYNTTGFTGARKAI